WDDTRVWKEAGAAGDGAFYTVVGTNPTDDFKSKMAAKVGNNEIIYCSNYAYDGVKILAQAMAKVGTKPEDIKNELYNVDYKGGVSSKEIKFDKNGDPTDASYIIKVAKGGKAEEKK
ncbi:hypothetical protein HY224_02335, partial [Candidatus Uhrbacteria bacterium]|nr:hypothetical protein [Candidatus Uhrbacteria bacterium]